VRVAQDGMNELNEEEIDQIYEWVNGIKISRKSNNLSRDFSDGVLTAKLVSGFFPKIVELHNYSAANSVQQKQYNWNTLNQKVFVKMGFTISSDQIAAVCNRQYGAIELVLHTLRWKIEEIDAAGGKLPALKEKTKLWLLPPQKFKAGRRMQQVVHGAVEDAKHVSHADARQGAQSSTLDVAARGRAGEEAGAPPEIRTRPRRASLELRSSELKKRCMKHLGTHFQDIYDYLQHERSRCDDARGLASPDGQPLPDLPDLESRIERDLCRIVGRDLMGYTKLVEQLLFIEECLQQPKSPGVSPEPPALDPKSRSKSTH